MSRDRSALWLVGAMIVWSLFAVGGVYVWAATPLMIAAVVLVAITRPWIRGAAGAADVLDWCLAAAVIAVAIPLVPLPPAMVSVLSPHAAELRTLTRLAPPEPGAWLALSIVPDATAYALGMVITALIVFRTARELCARGMTRRLIRVCAFAGLVAAVLAIAIKAAGDPTLIYGLWPTQAASARPYGPFVNRNHFATWLLMAAALAAGYVMAARVAGPSPARLTARIVAAFEWLGTWTMWMLASAAVMILALVISTSRSGLVALVVAIAGAAWMARARLAPGAKLATSIAGIALAAFLALYVNVQPLLSRVDETLTQGQGGRPEIWQATLRIVRDFPMTGTGPGTYQTAMQVYQPAPRFLFFNQAHNQPLQILAEGGVLLAAPVLVSVIVFVVLCRRRLAADTTPAVWLRIGGIAAVIAVAVQSLWETGLRMPANALLFALAAAVAVHPLELRSARLPSAAKRDPERHRHEPQIEP